MFYPLINAIAHGSRLSKLFRSPKEIESLLIFFFVLLCLPLGEPVFSIQQ